MGTAHTARMAGRLQGCDRLRRSCQNLPLSSRLVSSSFCGTGALGGHVARCTCGTPFSSLEGLCRCAAPKAGPLFFCDSCVPCVSRFPMIRVMLFSDDTCHAFCQHHPHLSLIDFGGAERRFGMQMWPQMSTCVHRRVCAHAPRVALAA